VTLGTQQNGQTEITQGVKDGDPVVTQGSLFLQFANTYKD
jgi:multidrug efflux pump subunit AcrA (membrane-fusion protein)